MTRSEPLRGQGSRAEHRRAGLVAIGGKFARYFLTAGTAAIVDAGGFAWLYALGLATLPAAVTSFALAAVVNFLLTARFVFGHRATGRGFTRFLLAALVGLAVNVGVTLVAAELLGVPAVLAKIVGIGTAFTVNFLLNLLVVFRPATRTE
jgi:putative flippase GtrA